MLATLGKPESLIRHVEDRAGHDRRYALDVSKLGGVGVGTGPHLRGSRREDGALVRRERVVVAAHQERGTLQGVLRPAVWKAVEGVASRSEEWEVDRWLTRRSWLEIC